MLFKHELIPQEDDDYSHDTDNLQTNALVMTMMITIVHLKDDDAREHMKFASCVHSWLMGVDHW